MRTHGAQIQERREVQGGEPDSKSDFSAYGIC